MPAAIRDLGGHVELTTKIRDVPDFPRPGILFKDITTLLQDPAAFRQTIDLLADRCRDLRADTIVGLESRGFIFGAPLAMQLGLGFVPIRKLGKLPWRTVKAEYELEYGNATIEMHVDGVSKGQRVLVVDDLLATGGTARAAIQLVEELGAQIAALAVVIELKFLKGRARLGDYPIVSLIEY